MFQFENIEWFICSKPESAVNKITGKQLTKDELNQVVFDKKQEFVSLSFPLNDNLLFYVNREYKTPINVRQLFTIIYKFYKEPLEESNIESAFLEMEGLLEEWEEYHEGDLSKLTKYDVFTDTCTPDFCGLEFGDDGSHYVLIGPE